MTTSRLTLIVLVLAISSAGLAPIESHATACRFVSKELADERSDRYKDRVRIEVTKQNAAYFVEVFFPPKTEAGTLLGVSLFKGAVDYSSNSNSHDFTISLKVTEQDDGRMYSSYRLKDKFAKDNYIAAIYGGGCGFEIQYLVDFGESDEQ